MQVMENGTGGTMGSNGSGVVEDSSSTKARLNGILESFHAFDSDMKTGTRVRRENDEHRIAQLTAELTRLEKTLNQEIKRRVEMNKSVQVVRKWYWEGGFSLVRKGARVCLIQRCSGFIQTLLHPTPAPPHVSAVDFVPVTRDQRYVASHHGTDSSSFALRSGFLCFASLLWIFAPFRPRFCTQAK